MIKASRVLEETFAEDILSTDESDAAAFSSSRPITGVRDIVGTAVGRDHISH